MDSYLLNMLYLVLSHDRESVERIITFVGKSYIKKRIVIREKVLN